MKKTDQALLTPIQLRTALLFDCVTRLTNGITKSQVNKWVTALFADRLQDAQQFIKEDMCSWNLTVGQLGELRALLNKMVTAPELLSFLTTSTQSSHQLSRSRPTMRL